MTLNKITSVFDLQKNLVFWRQDDHLKVNMLGLIAKLLKRRSSQCLDNPVFGRMRLIKSARGREQFWQGRFNYEGKWIDIRVLTDGSIPTPEQEDFLKEIMSRQEPLTESAAPYVAPHFELWCEKSYQNNFLKEFTCTAVVIPKKVSDECEWCLTYAKRSDLNFIFTIFFKGKTAFYTDLDW